MAEWEGQAPKVASYCTDSLPVFGSLGLSIPLTFLLGVKCYRRQEPVNFPWCKKLTLDCPAKGEAPT